MTVNIRRLSGLIAALVFVIGVIVFVNALAMRRAVSERKSFVVSYVVSKNGMPVSFRTHVARATGEWKDTAYSVGSGNVRTLVGTPEAQYEVGPASVEFLQSTGPMQELQALDESFRSADYHRSHPEFVREEYVAGFKTYVHRAVSGDDPESWVESYYAPEFGLTSLKAVRHFSQSEVSVTEAISVQFRDVAEDEVALPRLPVKFDKAEQLQRDAEASGDVEWANEQSKQIKNAKQKQSAN